MLLESVPVPFLIFIYWKILLGKEVSWIAVAEVPFRFQSNRGWISQFMHEMEK